METEKKKMLNKSVMIFIVVFLSLSTSLVRAVDLSNSQAFTYDDGNGNTLLYRLFFPPGFDSPGVEFPLVLFLHGAGEIGTDNLAQVSSHIDGLIEATRSAEHASFLLAPQVQPGQGGWSALWSATDLAPAMDLTLQVIDQLEQQYSIDTSRRSVTGLSMGGFGTWDLVAKQPDMFAAAAPMSGGGDPDQALNLRDVPIWNFHGRNDNTVPASYSRDMISAIEQVGGSPLYQEVSGGHGIWEPIYDDPDDEFYDWLIGGIEPPLASVIYDPLTGNLKLDARQAPGGAINHFQLILAVPFDLQATMTVDEITVDTSDFATLINKRFLIFNNSFGDGFKGIADFGAIMPKGLSSQDLHFYFSMNQYRSPETGSDLRTFRLVTAIPEPTAMMLGFLSATSMLVMTRKRTDN